MDKAKFQWMCSHTSERAADHLESMQQRANMLRLYQHYYPEKYLQTTASLAFARPEDYSEKEIEFLTLVDEQFFPLPLVMTDLERIAHIPIDPIGTSWYYDEFEGLGATEKFLMCLIHDISSEVWDDVESELGKELPPVEDYISDVLLRQEAKKARGMISRLPLAMEVLTQSTDNIWLDMTYESEITDADWTVEVIDILTEAYTEAQTIMKEYREFIEWLDQDSKNCVKVVRLWNRCKETVPQLHSHYITHALAG
ncbi:MULTISPECIES: hypothetical protein [Pseudanabaena]|jgi:hypothetical protein|uniref:hypothetical protein n=1 Tax=Pseudanabaena TaxID=1152 RepID=UPI00247B0233|nr:MULTISPECIES: hypothetical protein [Pseudanabaena]MEA5488178.1 hypothetical protein [Pseudanabaena sp. CCNP1317]WGS75411.1 hypothetical protein OA858_26545 [Pseudanabaena galeata CCNP1313]